MDSKISAVIRGVFIIVLGVLVAVCGVGTAVNTYFGVVCIVAGVLLIAFSALAISKKLPTPVGYLVLSGILITIAVALFMSRLSLEVIVGLLIYGIMGAGFGLIAAGIFEIVKRQMVFAIVEMGLGGLLVLFTALYLGIPEFQQAFWIIVGILMIVFGVFIVVAALVDKKIYAKKKK